ncbi:hypothetical protein ACIBMZ_14720 [Micromonospora sp. NPDC049900]|uniref:hypothetical protein n=1 Tax=Micromonospora sp. NPDC049900 TaxID=3364275 RepID=UPI003795F0AC
MRRLRRVAVSGLGTFVLTVLLPAGPAQAAATTPFPPGAPLTQAAGVFGAVILFALAVAVLRGPPRPPAAPDPVPDPDVSVPVGPFPSVALPTPTAALPTLADRFSPLHTVLPPTRTAVLSRPPGPAAAPRSGTRLRPAGRPPVERTAPGRTALVDPYALTAEVRLDGRTVTVSLDGARTDRPGPPHTWCAGTRGFTSAALPLLLGGASGRCLQVDLARCPDALTVGGPPPQQRWYAWRLVRQVVDAGGRVTVVGDLDDDGLPAGCHRVADVFDPRLPQTSGIVLAAGLDRRAVQVARQLSVCGGPVPVLLGDAVPTRWSIRVSATG